MSSLSLTGLQKRHLRGLAHPLKPLVQVGKNGLTDAVVQAIEKELDNHELIKVRASDAPEGKKELSAQLAERTSSAWVGTVGHVVTLYRQQSDPEKRQIELPRPGAKGAARPVKPPKAASSPKAPKGRTVLEETVEEEG